MLGLGVTGLVVAATLWRGMPVVVALGVLLSLLSFALRMKHGLVRGRFSAAARPSRRLYPAGQEARLPTLRPQIMIFELEGALFFASGDRLLDEVDALGPEVRCLVLDLGRVSAIDESGAVALQQCVARGRRRGLDVSLAGVRSGSAPVGALKVFAPDLEVWPDTDRATEAAERLLLGEADAPLQVEWTLGTSLLLEGLGATAAELVMARMPALKFAAGALIFAEGDPADCLYVLDSGIVGIVSRPGPDGRSQRYLGISPGMMFGETAMLDHGGRSAAAVAESPTVPYRLGQADLDALQRSHPDIAARLYRNIALHLSQRLRSAASAWHASTR